MMHIDITPESIYRGLEARAKASDKPWKVWPEQNENIIAVLCEYFSRHPNFESNKWGSLQKNIILYGTIGCGKTQLMKLLQHNPRQDFTVINVHKVASDYTEKGIEGIRPYFGGPKMYCFDDLGIELEHGEKNHMGNKLNVMQYVLNMLYDYRRPFHITTNFSVPEIEAFYGNRIRSRLRENCNLLSFPETATDLRK